ncbi:MAG: hypothetical protein MUC92_12135 [Fimbriimonadaceae bacterium]|jgi:hypothetical protein|nr:hypothetical protein [Fimbriimonadaceae bacterium]
MSALRKEEAGLGSHVGTAEIIILIPPGAVRDLPQSPTKPIDDRPFWVRARSNPFVDVAVTFLTCLGQIALVAGLMALAALPAYIDQF